MPSVRFDIISIGTLARNRLWNENEVVRTAHATTTLIRSGKRLILIDPGLPPTAIGARLTERTGLKPERIDTVFLTAFKPQNFSGVEAFPKAKLLIHEVEQDFARAQLSRLIEQAPEEDIDRAYLEKELQLLERCERAEDALTEDVDLFPLFGFSPGLCGLLIKSPLTTALIAGAAVPTLDHFLAGQVLPDSRDIPQAQESLKEAYEIADLIVPGFDNVFLNPRTQGM
jgi:glyoxylase-like metal-dependent hydrolase (beta-lactamase superfamily II)